MRKWIIKDYTIVFNVRNLSMPHKTEFILIRRAICIFRVITITLLCWVAVSMARSNINNVFFCCCCFRMITWARMGERARGEGCRVMLRHCLAIIVRKEGCQGDPGDFWMYESGYLLFQVIVKCSALPRLRSKCIILLIFLNITVKIKLEVVYLLVTFCTPSVFP